MKFKNMLSLVLVGTILVMTLCCPTSYFATVDYTYKIDNTLAKKLEDMNNDDTIRVSVWFTNIDYNVVNSKVISKVKNKISRDVLNIVKANKNEVALLSLNSVEQSKSLKEQKEDSLEMQTAIKTEREIASDMQVVQNKEIFNKLFPNKYRQPEVIYSCSYAPNVEMYLTKDQVYHIIKSSDVEEIYYADPNLKLVTESTDMKSENSKSTSEGNNHDTPDENNDYFKVTGIDQVRKVWGLDGTGVNVGIYDSNFIRPEEVDFFDRREINYSKVKDECFTHNVWEHGSFVSCIINGVKKNSSNIVEYSGAVPNASLYWSAGYGYKETFEFLIDDFNCNVINMSMVFGGGTINQPGDISKWLDHIAISHSVHLAIAAGNYGDVGVPSSNMASNAIVVGNCYNNGDYYDGMHNGSIVAPSSYSSSDSAPYKPDLLAPSVNMVTPAGSIYGATSQSTPLVASALAQFCQLSAVLRSNPVLMKALILAGTKRSDEMINNNVESIPNTVSVAFDHKHGCGMLNAVNCYTAFVDYSFYNAGVVSLTQTEFSFEKYISVKSMNKYLRIVATWEKVSIVPKIPHENDDAIIYDDVFYFYITDPNGVEYKTEYAYDTKALISFKASTSGIYKFRLVRKISSRQELNCAFAYALMHE